MNNLIDIHTYAIPGSLEVFHASMLKYTPKRIHFFYDSMLARTMLAVMDHNLNVGREQATTKTGNDQSNRVWPTFLATLNLKCFTSFYYCEKHF